jgi:hypothetical protein
MSDHKSLPLLPEHICQLIPNRASIDITYSAANKQRLLPLKVYTSKLRLGHE